MKLSKKKAYAKKSEKLLDRFILSSITLDVFNDVSAELLGFIIFSIDFIPNNIRNLLLILLYFLIKAVVLYAKSKDRVESK